MALGACAKPDLQTYYSSVGTCNNGQQKCLQACDAPPAD